MAWFQSVEKEMREDTATDKDVSEEEGAMDSKAQDELSNWIQVWPLTQFFSASFFV